MNNHRNSRLAALLLSACMLLCSVSVYAGSNVDTFEGVTQDMCTPQYWIENAGEGADEILMTAEEIKEFNSLAIAASGTNVYGIEDFKEVFNAESVKASLSNKTAPARDWFIDGIKIDKEKYIEKINKVFDRTAWTDTSHESVYAVAVRVTAVRNIPTNDVLRYSATDTDDENISTSLLVNEPFLIRQYCRKGSDEFYWGYARNCTGWVSAEDLAICKDKDEWLDAWKVEPGNEDFLVVTQSRLTLEPADLTPDISERQLTLGTILKLVPQEDRPENIAGRSGWHNYVVYLPCRDDKGRYYKQPAYIQTRYDVNIGFVPLTSANLIRLSFSCLGDRYGWGNMLGAMDCSGFMRNVYRCCGLEIPRNTNLQLNVPGTVMNLSLYSDEEKQAELERMAPGTLLFFSGHEFMYLGSLDGTAYCISDLGNVVEPSNDSVIQSVYTVSVNPLTAKRANGNTWLGETGNAVNFWGIEMKFDDVPEDSYYYDSVMWALEKGITMGTSSYTFSPLKTCTVEEAVLMISRSLGMPYTDLDDAGELCTRQRLAELMYLAYSDDASGEATAEQQVEWAYENGITDGLEDGSFGGERLCNRAQVITMIYRANK